MKKSIFVAIAFIAATSITTQLFAQEAAKIKPGYNVKANVKARVVQTDNGCSIVFESSAPSSTTGTTGSVTPTSKKGYDYYMAKSSFSVSASDNSVTEVTSPRDPASGQATGKRQHKPMTISKEYDKSSPKLAESVSSTGTSSDATAVKGSGGGVGKVNVQDISFTKRCGGKTTKISCDGGECEIPIGDCPNGDCNITASWSWGESNSTISSTGTAGSGRCSIDFFLKIEDGVCTAMAINEKGLPGGTSKKTTTKK